jgi:hypothetical protein
LPPPSQISHTSFSKKQNMIKKIYQLNRNEKFVDKAQQCFAFLHIKSKFKFAIQWSWLLKMNLIWVIFNIADYANTDLCRLSNKVEEKLAGKLSNLKSSSRRYSNATFTSTNACMITYFVKSGHAGQNTCVPALSPLQESPTQNVNGFCFTYAFVHKYLWLSKYVVITYNQWKIQTFQFTSENH